MSVELGEAFVSIRANMQHLSRDLAGARQRISRSLERTGRALQQTGGELTSRVTLPVVALGAAIVRTSFVFRKEMNRVQALTGATGKQFQEMERLAKEMGRATEFSAGQAAGAMSFLAQAGFETNEILDALPGTLQLASAGQLDLARAADIASNVMQQFGIEAKNLGRVNDVLAATASSSNTSIEQLAQALSMAGPAANSAGISLEEMAAAVGFLGNAGIQSTRAGTTLRRAILNLVSPTDQMRDAMEKINLQVTDAEGNFLSLDEIIRQIETGFQDIGSAAERTAILADIFGARAVSGIASMVGQSRELKEEIRRLNEDIEGFAENIQEIQLQGIVGALLELKSAAEGAALAFAGRGGMDEAIISLSETLTGWLRALADANPETLKLGVRIAGVAALAGPLIAALGFMTMGVRAFFLALTGPVGLTVALASALAGVVTLTTEGRAIMRPFIEEIVAGFQSMKDNIAQIMGPAMRVVFGAFLDDTESMGGSLFDILAVIVDTFRSSFRTIASAFQVVGKTLGAGGAQIVALFQGRFGDIIEIGKAWENDMVDLFDTTFKEFDASAARSALAQARLNEELLVGSRRADHVANRILTTNAAYTGFAGAIDKGDKAVRELNDDINDLIDNNKELFGSTQEVTEGLGNMGDGVEGVKDAFEEFTGNFRSDEQRLEMFRRKLEFLNQQFQDGEISAARYDSEVRTLSQGLSDMVKDTGDAEEATDSLWRSMDQIAEDTITGIRDAWVSTFQDLFRGQIKSFGDFFKSVKNLFIDMLAEMAASLVASKIFQFFGGEGGFSLGNFSISFGGGGAGDAAANAGISAAFSKGFDKLAQSSFGKGIASALGIGAGSSATTTALGAASGPIAGTALGGAAQVTAGAPGFIGPGVAQAASASSVTAGAGLSSAIAAAAPAAAVIAMPFVARELFGGGNIDKMFAKFQGFSGRGPLGTQVGGGGGVSFAGGPMSGFAAEFAKSQGVTAFNSENLGLAAFKTDLETLKTVLADAERQFETLKKEATNTFNLGQSGSAKMGQALKDGVIDQTELAQLGFIEMGERIVHAETGAVSLGDVTATQFRKIVDAVKRGEIRMGALTGDTKLTQGEMRALGDIGITAHRKVVEGASRAAGAERSFGNTADSVMNNVRSASAAAGKSFGQSFQNGANQAAGAERSFGNAAKGVMNNVRATSAAAGRSFGQSFSSASQQAASAIKSFGGQGRSALESISNAARQATGALGEIPRTVDVSINERVKRIRGGGGSSSEVRGLAHGGIVRQPTFALIGEGREDEVVAPLSDFNRMVDERSNRGMSVTINQNINGATPGEVERQTRRAMQRVADEFPIR